MLGKVPGMEGELESVHDMISVYMYDIVKE